MQELRQPSKMSGDSAVEVLDPAAAVASIVDPLPTPEEIASAAAAAAAAHRPSSLKEESAAAASLKGLGKGLGGAGLASKRKSKGGSTISAATAPAALAVRRDLAAPSGGGARGSSAGPSRAGAAAAAAAAAGGAADGGAAAGTAASSGSGAAGRVLQKEADGARSFNLKLSDDSLDNEENEEEEWESASTDEDVIELDLTGEAPVPRGAKAAGRASSSNGPAAGKAAATSVSSSSPASWREWVEESFDSSALLLAGGVLAVCAGSLLVLGGVAWTCSRGS